ncbi:MAG: hypothetical protein JXJ19_03305 [Elusimicrobia bacterium]|nr:hypothetical protein [Elusimicrobiota bacterium]
MADPRKFSILLAGVIVLLGSGICRSEEKDAGKNTRSGEAAAKENKLQVLEMPDYKYTGAKYKSPFIPKRKGASSTVAISGSNKPIQISDVDTDILKVTGYFSDSEGAYAILSGGEVFYIAKKGRLYTEDDVAVVGAAAVIKKDKVLLISEDNTIYEYSIPK